MMGLVILKSNSFHIKRIKYNYSADTWVEIKLDNQQHRYVDPWFSDNIVEIVSRFYREIKTVYKVIPSSSSLFDLSRERNRNEIIVKFKTQINKLLDFEKELLFIPAGRSLLSTLSDQLQYIHPHLLDYPMRQFINRINGIKSFFNKNIDEIITERQALSSSIIDFSSVRKTQKMVKRILKGEYIHDREGGKLFIGQGSYIKINYVSSGQQESVWILLSLFLIVLDKVNAFVFVEEPEAHLFPDAQKDLVELMSFLTNSLNSSFFITTHSPYILSAVNNHVYAHLVGQKFENEVSKVIDKSQWINPNTVGGFLVDGGHLINLFDNELNMLKTELIDSASSRINNEYDQIFNLEYGDS